MSFSNIHILVGRHPVPENEFNPNTFEPQGEDMAEINDRGREDPPTILPTYGLKPKKIREGQMIGMYESKQDIYLIMAHKINALQTQIEDLQNQINNLRYL